MTCITYHPIWFGGDGTETADGPDALNLPAAVKQAGSAFADSGNATGSTVYNGETIAMTAQKYVDQSAVVVCFAAVAAASTAPTPGQVAADQQLVAAIQAAQARHHPQRFSMWTEHRGSYPTSLGATPALYQGKWLAKRNDGKVMVHPGMGDVSAHPERTYDNIVEIPGWTQVVSVPPVAALALPNTPLSPAPSSYNLSLRSGFQWRQVTLSDGRTFGMLSNAANTPLYYEKNRIHLSPRHGMGDPLTDGTAVNAFAVAQANPGSCASNATIKAFQTSAGITADGIYGPATDTALRGVLPNNDFSKVQPCGGNAPAGPPAPNQTTIVTTPPAPSSGPSTAIVVAGLAVVGGGLWYYLKKRRR